MVAEMIVELLCVEYKQNEIYKNLSDLGINCDLLCEKISHTIFEVISSKKNNVYMSFTELSKSEISSYLQMKHMETIMVLDKTLAYYAAKRDYYPKKDDQLIKQAFKKLVNEFFLEYHLYQVSVN